MHNDLLTMITTVDGNANRHYIVVGVNNTALEVWGISRKWMRYRIESY